MRAALVNHRYVPFHGGSELYIQKLAEWLVASGWDARVITTDAYDLEYFWDAGRRRVEAPAEEVINGVRIERLPVRHVSGSIYLFRGGRRALGEASRILTQAAPFRCASQYLLTIPGLEGALDAQPRPDLMFATNLGLENLPVAALASARRLSVPFVLLPFAHIGDARDRTARRYVSMPHQRELVKRADLIVALTHLEAAFLEEIGADGRRIVVAGAGVDPVAPTATASRVASGSTGRPFTILSVGAMARDKGTFDLVEASRRLAREGLEHRLILVGPELSAFSRWFQESGASGCEWIEKRGVVPETEKLALFHEADVFALPSRTESFGIVYLEAWAQRLPVVGASAGAVDEVISDGVDGLLVPFGDVEAIASALRRLASERSYAVSLGESGYEKICRCYTWKQVLGRIEGAIERVLGIEVS